MTPLTLNPDRLFPAEPGVRAIARTIYHEISHLPLLSPHGHLDARLFRDNEPFSDPADLLVSSDHYVVRLLHARGLSLDALGTRSRPGAPGDEQDHPLEGREIWRALCTHWEALGGTPSRLWLEHILSDLFELEERPSPETADSSYDHCVAMLQRDELRPRSLYRRFNLEVLTTTDPPAADLAVHDALLGDSSFTGRLLPTFRPDGVVDPNRADFTENLTALEQVTGIDLSDYAGLVRALEQRRDAFRERGATASDHGVEITTTEHLPEADAARLYRAVRAGEANAAQIEAFKGHMVSELARMAVDDGLVMQLHLGVARDYSRSVFERFGQDVGQDFPVNVEYTRTLRPLLSRFGDDPGFRAVLYTIDETLYSREIGPLVSYFPSLYAGAPWWFLDAPDAMARAFAAVGEVAGIANCSGFVDDTRSLCGIGARHDVARRSCAAYLARVVAEHRIGEDEAVALAKGYAYDTPKAVFKL